MGLCKAPDRMGYEYLLVLSELQIECVDKVFSSVIAFNSTINFLYKCHGIPDTVIAFAENHSRVPALQLMTD